MQLDIHTVFEAGVHGYHTFRIPSLIVTASGTMLALCEGRRNGRNDSGVIDLVLRRSFDNGETWSDIRVIQSDGSNTWGNPCPVVDRATGTIWLLLTQNSGMDREAEIIAGTSQASRTVWVMRSDDDGENWSTPQEITSSVKRSDWTWYATGPGVGIQTSNGRLIVPCDHIGRNGSDAASHIVASDDHGTTWYLGGWVPGAATNECQIIERGDGVLLLNMRSHDRNLRRRLISTSEDGGTTWSPARSVPELIDPICQASMLRMVSKDGVFVLFSNLASAELRENLTIQMSDDDGVAWRASQVVHAGPAAYSCLAALPDGRIACLYENGEESPYERISLARFKW